MQEFRERQSEMEQVVYHFQNEKKAIEAKSDEEIRRLHEEFFEETRRLKCDHADQLEKQRIETEKAYDKSLDDRIKHILVQNRSLCVELNLHKRVRHTSVT